MNDEQMMSKLVIGGEKRVDVSPKKKKKHSPQEIYQTSAVFYKLCCLQGSVTTGRERKVQIWMINEFSAEFGDYKIGT